MSNVQNIQTGSIDPDSTVNVRLRGVDENVEKVKASIERFGYWPEYPIVVRPHPNPGSGYEYEHVTGQCRFKACLASGVVEIPAFVLNLSDDEAIQRSWGENEARGDLSYSDKSDWVEKIYKKYCGDGHTTDEALKLAAQFLGVSVSTAINYYTLVALPDDLKDTVDKGSLPTAVARSIVKNTYNGARVPESQQTMRERANWYLDLNREHRKYTEDALKSCGHNDSVESLNARIKDKITASELTVEYKIPGELHSELLRWGKGRGLEKESEIVARMVVDAIRGESNE